MNSLAVLLALPLCGFLVNGLLGARLPKSLVAVLACGLPALSFAVTLRTCVALVAGHGPITTRLLTWMAFPGFTVDVALSFDQLTAVMCLVVTGIGTLIHVYSVGYMSGDAGFARYFAYLNLFVFFMLTLVLGKSLLVMFVGWEGVGLASYLLIGFWFEDPAKTAAGLKAFVVNRVGDAGFLLGIFMMQLTAGSLDFQAVNTFFSSSPSSAVTTAIALLLFVGVCGKSAQIPLHVWLPDAMAGPTPVSALIHAATMVTAGVYLLARLSGLYVHAPEAMTVVAWVGAATALLGATLGMRQFNLKKVLAYSTISQIGFMVMACGLGAFTVGLFHLVTHAFFKACLFLGAGAVLHALGGEEDMRNMGALARKLPLTFVAFVAGTLALCGIPPFAGFFSKDEILWRAWGSADGFPWLWLVGLAASGLTACYMFRALWLTFLGSSHVGAEKVHHIHQPPASMSIVLSALAVGSLLVGFLGLPRVWQQLLGVGAPFYEFLAPMFASTVAEGRDTRGLELLLMAGAVFVALAGAAVSALYLRRDAAGRQGRPSWLAVTLERGFFFDSSYETLVRLLDRLSESVLARTVEAALTRATLVQPAQAVRWVSTLFARLQTGSVQSYVFYGLIGLATALWWAAAHV